MISIVNRETKHDVSNLPQNNLTKNDTSHKRSASDSFQQPSRKTVRSRKRRRLRREAELVDNHPVRLRAVKKVVKLSEARQTSLCTDLMLAAHEADDNKEAEKEHTLTEVIDELGFSLEPWDGTYVQDNCSFVHMTHKHAIQDSSAPLRRSGTSLYCAGWSASGYHFSW
jgi:hypothetical protein